MAQIFKLVTGLLLVLLPGYLLGQMNQGTVFATGAFTHETEKVSNATLYNIDLRGGVYILKNRAIGFRYTRFNEEISNSNHYLYNSNKYSLFFRANYNLMPGLNVFWQPVISRSVINREINYTVGQSNTSTVYSGKLQLGLSAFLSNNLAVEVIPLEVKYTNSHQEINEFHRKVSEDASDFSVSVLPSPTSFTLNLYLFNQKTAFTTQAPFLRDKKQLGLTVQYENVQYDSSSQVTGFTVAPSFMVYHSKGFAGGFGIGVDHSSIKYFENHMPGNYTTTNVFMDPFLRFNKWITSTTALFISPYASFGLEFRKSLGPQVSAKDMVVNLEGGARLGISAIISPKLVLETYTKAISYRTREHLNENLENLGKLSETQTFGLDFNNLYVSVAFLLGEADEKRQ